MNKAFVGTVLLAALVPATASAATLSVGSQHPLARSCFLAADASTSDRSGEATCTRSLAEEALSARDRIATLVNRGVVRMRGQNGAGAGADFDAALGLRANQPEALMNKGLLLLAGTGRVEDTIPLFDTALRERPERPWVAYYSRGMAYELSGRDAAAYRDYRQAAALKPSWSLPKAALARFTGGPRRSPGPDPRTPTLGGHCRPSAMTKTAVPFRR